jgi:hypothetical protein
MKTPCRNSRSRFNVDLLSRANEATQGSKLVSFAVLHDSRKPTISAPSVEYVAAIDIRSIPPEYASRTTSKRGIPNGTSLLNEEDNNNA